MVQEGGADTLASVVRGDIEMFDPSRGRGDEPGWTPAPPWYAARIKAASLAREEGDLL